MINASYADGHIKSSRALDFIKNAHANTYSETGTTIQAQIRLENGSRIYLRNGNVFTEN